MIRGGNGGLTIGHVQMDQYYIVNEYEPYTTKEEAEKSFEHLLELLEFQITGANGKFYVWCKR